LKALHHILVSSAQILALSTWVSLGQPALPYQIDVCPLFEQQLHHTQVHRRRLKLKAKFESG
jgi:hypothetical protein